MSKTQMGSSIDTFLKKEGIFDETQAQAINEIVAWQPAEAMKQKNISKNKMATPLKTSRTPSGPAARPKKRHHARQPATRRRNGRAPRERRVGVGDIQVDFRASSNSWPATIARLNSGSDFAAPIHWLSRCSTPTDTWNNGAMTG